MKITYYLYINLIVAFRVESHKLITFFLLNNKTVSDIVTSVEETDVFKTNYFKNSIS